MRTDLNQGKQYLYFTLTTREYSTGTSHTGEVTRNIPVSITDILFKRALYIPFPPKKQTKTTTATTTKQRNKQKQYCEYQTMLVFTFCLEILDVCEILK